MKISNSKKELARIISENGGWRDEAEWAAQDEIIAFFSGGKPEHTKGDMIWSSNGEDGDYVSGIEGVNKIANWHQTLLSRDEYFHLHPVAKAAPEPVAEAKPTVEQLATDYHNRKDYAERKQKEADAAKADAEDKLKALELACEALGLIVSPITTKKDPELVITDWRDLKVDDIIEYVDGGIKNKIGMTGPVVEFDPDDNDGMMVRMKCDNGPNKGRLGWPMKWRFIRRP